MNERKRSVFLDTGLVLLSNLAVQGSTFVVRLVIGYSWGDEDLGLYSLAITLNYILLLLCSVGIPQAAVKFIAERREGDPDRRGLVTTTVVAGALAGVVAAMVLYPLAGWTASIWKMKALPSLVVIFLLGLPFSLTLQAILSALNGLRQLKEYSLFNGVNALLLIVATVIAALLHLPIDYAVWAYILGTTISMLWGLWSLRGYLVRLPFQRFMVLAKDLLRFGVKLMAANSVHLANTRADLLLVGYFRSPAETGHYAMATTLARMLLLLPGAVQVITYPVTTEYFSAGLKERASRFMERSALYTFVLLALVGLLVVFYSEDFLRFYDPDFLPAVTPLRILTVFFVFYGATSAIGGAFASYGRPDISLKLALASMVANLSLNLALIPLLGIDGAALATGLALMVFVPSYPVLLNRIAGVRVELRRFWVATLLFLILGSLLYFLGKLTHALLVEGIVLLGSVLVILRVLFDTDELKSYLRLKPFSGSRQPSLMDDRANRT